MSTQGPRELSHMDSEKSVDFILNAQNACWNWTLDLEKERRLFYFFLEVAQKNWKLSTVKIILH